MAKCFICGWPTGSEKVVHVAVSFSHPEQGQPAGVLESLCYSLRATQRARWHKQPCVNAAMLPGEVDVSAGHGSAVLLQSPARGRCVQVSLQVPTLELSLSCHSSVTEVPVGLVSTHAMESKREWDGGRLLADPSVSWTCWSQPGTSFLVFKPFEKCYSSAFVYQEISVPTGLPLGEAGLPGLCPAGVIRGGVWRGV